MKQEYLIPISAKSLSGIRDVLSLAKADYVVLEGKGDNVQFTTYHNTVFKRYELEIEDIGYFNLRLRIGSLAMLLQEGTIKIILDNDTVNVELYKETMDKIDSLTMFQKEFQTVRDTGVDKTLTMINQLLTVTKDSDKKVRLFNIKDIMSIASFVKNDQSGIILQDGIVYTQGSMGAYYVYAKADTEQMELAIPYNVLTPLVKYLKGHRAESVEVFEEDNWMIFIFGNTQFGFISERVDNVTSLAFLEDEQYLSEGRFDFTNMYETLRGTRVTKDSKYDFRIMPEIGYMSTDEIRIGRMLTKLPFVSDEDDERMMEEFMLDIKIAKVAIPLLKTDKSNLVTAKDYGNYVSLTNVEGITLLLIKAD